MKKTLFFYLFLGDTETNEVTILSRLFYAIEQLTYINNLLRHSNEYAIPDKKIMVLAAPLYACKAMINIGREYGYEFYPTIYHDNLYEYPGFKAMQDTALKTKDDELFLYLHSKGIVNHSEQSEKLFKLHVSSLLSEGVDSYFNNKTILKGGLFPSQEGWLWHNFFWIRSSYMKTIAVDLKEDRYDFESLIGKRGNLEGHSECAQFKLSVNDTSTFPVKEWYLPDDLSAYNEEFNKVLQQT